MRAPTGVLHSALQSGSPSPCALVLSLLACLVGCSETVGFLTLDLVPPQRSPAIVCAKDPRRATDLTVRAVCDDGTHERTAAVDGSSVSLGDVPLGECTLEVEAGNEHGRVVLKGSTTVTIERGDNPSATVQLVEQSCDSSCDTDGDGLPDQDEQALKTNAADVDTDGDGLEDGLELYQCCTDPLLAEGQCRALVIQRVEPGYAPVDGAVMIKASAPLDRPEVKVGGQALDNLIADSTIAFGMVSAGSALGEVELTSAGARVTYAHLFAVLRSAPESITEISNKVPGLAPVIYQLVDQAFDGPRQYLLGRAFTKSSDGSTASIVPVLLLLDQQAQAGTKGMVALTGDPVALAVVGGTVLVLLDVGGRAEVVLYTPPPASGVGLGVPKKLKFDAQLAAGLSEPVEIVLEPSADTGQLLLRRQLLRFRFDSAGQVTGTRLLTLDGAVGPAGGAACIGMAHHQPSNAAALASTYLSCNLDLPCAPGASCEPQGVLVRVVAACLTLGSTLPAVPPQCASIALLDTRQPLLGNPVVEAKSSRVYALSASGVAMAPLGAGGALSTIVPMHFDSKTTAHDLMAVLGDQLFVVDGAEVWRMDPTNADPARRPGKSFVAGRGPEQARMVAVSPDGASLTVGIEVTGGFTWIAGVCLTPCK